MSAGLAAAIPGAESVTLADNGHLSPAEVPAAFAHAVRQFVGRQPGGRE